MQHVVCWGESKAFFVSQRLVPCQLSGAPVISRGSCSEPCAQPPAVGTLHLPHGCPEGPGSCLCSPSLPPPALTLGNQMRQRQQPRQRRAALFEAVPPECAHRFHCLHLPCLAAAVTSCASSLCWWVFPVPSIPINSFNLIPCQPSKACLCPWTLCIIFVRVQWKSAFRSCNESQSRQC